MPFQRPTLSQLRRQSAADFTSGLPGADGTLRFSNLLVISTVLAGMSNAQYGYLDWIANQAVPFTCTAEFLEAWAGLKGVVRLAATAATGAAYFTGSEGAVIPAGTYIQRSDSVTYITINDATVTGGQVLAPINAVVAGAAGNCEVGTLLFLTNPIIGINSNGQAPVAMTGGADVETDDSLRDRMLKIFQAPPQGGDQKDYENWALAIPGVTRVWIERNGQGVGTVVVRFMMDITESANAGFPQGQNGVATLETRDIVASGDQLTVANYIYDLQPTTALVYAVAPLAQPVNFTIASLLPNTVAMKASVSAAIADCFFRTGSPGGPVYMADIDAAINAIPGIIDFIITSPLTDVIPGPGALPVVGTITWV